jgi:hypothetical protein
MILTLVQPQIIAAYLGLSLEKYRKKCSEKMGKTGRRTIYIFVDARFTGVVVKIMSLHG